MIEFWILKGEIVIVEQFIAIGFITITLGISIWCLIINKLDKSKIFLICVMLSFLLAFHGFDRLKYFKLLGIEAELTEMKDIKTEIFVKQEDVRQTTFQILELLLYSITTAPQLIDKDKKEIEREWVVLKTEKLFDTFKFNANEKKQIEYYPDKYKRINTLYKERKSLVNNSPERKDNHHEVRTLIDELYEHMQKEIEVLKNNDN